MFLRTARALSLLLILSHARVVAHALAAVDLRLLQMVPPQSQVVAGLRSPTLAGEPGSLLLFTGNNRLDLEDFFAITGADTARVIRQVVFTAAAGADGALSEHSLLVSGHFSRDTIFRFTEGGSEKRENYRGVSILVVPPLDRERDRFRQVRWLAIMNAEIAIFGTPASVQEELDRMRSNSGADPLLRERLSRLDRQDETWCLLPAPLPGGVVERSLAELDPRLGALAREGGSMQYGIHFGRSVEITASSNHDAVGGSDFEGNRFRAHGLRPSSFLSREDDAGGGEAKTAVVKISRRHYGECLEAFLNRSRTPAAH